MSDPSKPSALVLLDHHNHPTTTTTSSSSRDYRKGNWTLHETLILITAKRLDDERRARGPADPKHCPGSSAGARPGELRWKWVENYCWSNGCLRSQNQCNDKWDNLLRDYKKVRDYESRVSCAATNAGPSYWGMEKHERKDRNLPSNLASEVFDALSDVLARRNALRSNAARPPPVATVSSPAPPQQPLQPPPAAPPAQPSVSVEMSESSDSGGNEPDPNPKRQKVRDLGSSVARGASALARALLACEDRRDKRHRELVELEERRLRMEEERTEMGRQGLAGLISAVNNLSAAVHNLVTRHGHHNSEPR